MIHCSNWQWSRDADRNIVKVADYQWAGFNDTAAVWRATGQTRCKPCAANATYNTNVLQGLEVDLNKSSITWNNTRWVDNTWDTSTCKVLPDWVNTATATRCVFNSAGQSTGVQQQEKIDINPCSPTYNTTQWVQISYNIVCIACTVSTNRLVAGVCQVGKRIYTATQAIMGPNGKFTYNCTYHLEWTDCYHGPDIIETGLTTPHPITTGCNGV